MIDKKINNNNLNDLEVIKDDISRSAFTFNGQAIFLSKENTSGIMVRSYVDDEIDKIDLIQKEYLLNQIIEQLI